MSGLAQVRRLPDEASRVEGVLAELEAAIHVTLGDRSLPEPARTRAVAELRALVPPLVRLLAPPSQDSLL